jgi:hypothetical protein
LPFPISRDHLHSLVPGLFLYLQPVSCTLIPSPFKKKNVTLLSCLPFLRTCDVIGSPWIIKKSHHFKTVDHISKALSVMKTYKPRLQEFRNGHLWGRCTLLGSSSLASQFHGALYSGSRCWRPSLKMASLAHLTTLQASNALYSMPFCLKCSGFYLLYPTTIDIPSSFKAQCKCHHVRKVFPNFFKVPYLDPIAPPGSN